MLFVKDMLSAAFASPNDIPDFESHAGCISSSLLDEIVTLRGSDGPGLVVVLVRSFNQLVRHYSRSCSNKRVFQALRRNFVSYIFSCEFVKISLMSGFAPLDVDRSLYAQDY